MKNKVCIDCQVDLSGSHLNRKRCPGCAQKRARRPKTNLTEDQINNLRPYIGKISIEQIANKVGSSRSSLRRWARDNNVSFKYTGYSDDLKRRVLAFYEKHGKTRTQKNFKGVCVRSIVESSYGQFKPRQIPWTSSQLIELLKMSCFIPYEDQAKYFKRPLANQGSIVSAWQRKFKSNPTQVSGMCRYKARGFVKSSCPYIKIQGITKTPKKDAARWLALWVDVEKHLVKECPESIRLAVTAMAEFQRWLWGTDNVRQEVIKMRKKLNVAN